MHRPFIEHDLTQVPLTAPVAFKGDNGDDTVFFHLPMPLVTAGDTILIRDSRKQVTRYRVMQVQRNGFVTATYEPGEQHHLPFDHVPPRKPAPLIFRILDWLQGRRA